MPEFAAGEILTADKLNRRGIPKYGLRTSTSTGSTSATSVGVLRLDSIAIVSGRSYVVNVSCHPNFTVTTDTSRLDIRGSTSGTATTSSALLPAGQMITMFGVVMCFRIVYIAATTGTLSVLLCVARNSGSGTCTIFSDGTRCTELWIEDMGVATDTGVDV